jgi:hypothetical protein
VKKSYKEIALAICKNEPLKNLVLKSNNAISIMILILDFVIDFDEYYINKDTEPNEYLWQDVFEEIKRLNQFSIDKGSNINL